MQVTKNSVGALLLAGLSTFVFTGCPETEDVNFAYGAGHPGALLPGGGELLFELLATPDGPIAQAHFWFRSNGPNTPAEPPALAPGTCWDLTGPYPAPKPEGTTFADLGPTVTLTGGGKTVTLNKFENSIDNLGRGIDIIYGGNDKQSGLDPANFVTGVFYDVAFQGSNELDPPRFYMAKPFSVTSPQVGVVPVTFATGQAQKFTWVSLEPAAAETHNAERAFPYVQFVGDAGKVFFCPLNDGEVHTEFTVPAEIMSQLDPQGIVQIGQTTHMMAAMRGHRVDLYGVPCNTSRYSFQ